MLTWSEAVFSAVIRIAANKPDGVFTREELISEQGEQMCADTGSSGETPMQTVSRVLQELRSAGKIEFLDNKGTYRLNN